MKISIRFSEEAISLEALAKKNVSLGQYVKNKALGSSNTIAPEISASTDQSVPVNSSTLNQDVNFQELAKIILVSYIRIKAIANKTLDEDDERLIEKTYKEKIRRFLPNFNPTYDPGVK